MHFSHLSTMEYFAISKERDDNYFFLGSAKKCPNIWGSYLRATVIFKYKDEETWSWKLSRKKSQKQTKNQAVIPKMKINRANKNCNVSIIKNNWKSWYAIIYLYRWLKLSMCNCKLSSKLQKIRGINSYFK